ncbi:YggS family pyridoxal phosphate-dependent enzyme [Candidatus Peregrinibacteria bacterium]|nr:YggS family pyridoxal phosphate-dependent enzyme [Candidatus Peregrinibacteria bacterium]
MTKIAFNIEKIQQNIKKHSPYPEKVKIIAVTKNRSKEEVAQAIQSGIRCIGENRVQEAKQKLLFLSHEAKRSKIKKHFIGHLQSNKIHDAITLFDMIESVDSLRLGEKIDRDAQKSGKIMEILIQVNIALDETKYGCHPKDVKEILLNLSKRKNIQVRGLMTIGKRTQNSEETAETFKKFYKLFATIKSLEIPGIKMEELSMGMSNDYIIALQEGATMIRLGRAIFV